MDLLGSIGREKGETEAVQGRGWRHEDETRWAIASQRAWMARTLSSRGPGCSEIQFDGKSLGRIPTTR
jgi:G:T/U-mismatch repair DNA glycosylase